jgi:hypothetical protein
MGRGKPQGGQGCLATSSFFFYTEKQCWVSTSESESQTSFHLNRPLLDVMLIKRSIG